jgi:hypothetical protein
MTQIAEPETRSEELDARVAAALDAWTDAVNHQAPHAEIERLRKIYDGLKGTDTGPVTAPVKDWEDASQPVKKRIGTVEAFPPRANGAHILNGSETNEKNVAKVMIEKPLDATAIGNRLRQAVNAAATTPGKLAAAMGEPRNFIGNLIYASSKNPNRENISRIAEFLNVPTVWLLHGTGDMADAGGVKIIGTTPVKQTTTPTKTKESAAPTPPSLKPNRQETPAQAVSPAREEAGENSTAMAPAARACLVQLAKMWPGHEGVDWHSTTDTNLILLIRDAVEGDRKELLELREFQKIGTRNTEPGTDFSIEGKTLPELSEMLARAHGQLVDAKRQVRDIQFAIAGIEI